MTKDKWWNDEARKAEAEEYAVAVSLQVVWDVLDSRDGNETDEQVRMGKAADGAAQPLKELLKAIKAADDAVFGQEMMKAARAARWTTERTVCAAIRDME